MNGGQIGNEPFGRIETQNADRVEPLQAETNESSSTHLDVVQILLVRPLDPLPCGKFNQVKAMCNM